MTEEDDAIRHLAEEIRLLFDRDPIAGFERWAQLHTELAQNGYFDVCEALLAMMAEQGSSFPTYGRGILRYGEGWTADRAGRWEEAIGAYRDALRSFDKAGLDLACQIRCQIGSLYQDQGRFEQAEEEYRLALDAAADDHGRALILHNLGGLASLRHDPATARTHLEEAKAIFHETGDKYNHAAACVGLGDVLRDEKKLQDSIYMFVEAMRDFEELQNVKGMATAVAALALTYCVAGEYAISLDTYEKALDMFTAVSDRANIAKTLSNMGLLAAAQDATDEALALFQQALEEYRDIGDLHGQGIAEDNIQRLTAAKDGSGTGSEDGPGGEAEY